MKMQMLVVLVAAEIANHPTRARFALDIAGNFLNHAHHFQNKTLILQRREVIDMQLWDDHDVCRVRRICMAKSKHPFGLMYYFNRRLAR